MSDYKVYLGFSMTCHPWAECEHDECSWSKPMSPIARQAAREHAKRTGHAVLVVAEKRSVYRAEAKA